MGGSLVATFIGASYYCVAVVVFKPVTFSDSKFYTELLAFKLMSFNLPVGLRFILNLICNLIYFCSL